MKFNCDNYLGENTAGNSEAFLLSKGQEMNYSHRSPNHLINKEITDLSRENFLMAQELLSKADTSLSASIRWSANKL